MKPPRFKRFVAEDYKGAPDWFLQFLEPLSESMGDVAGGLTGRLTRSDNMLSIVEPFEFTSGTGGWFTQDVYGTAVASGSQTFSSGAFAVVRYDTVSEDSHAAITTGASWKFTAPIAGLYSINSTVSMNYTPAGSDFSVLIIRKNGAQPDYRLALESGWLFGENCLTGSVALSLAAGDYIQAMLFQNSGGDQSTVYGATEHRSHISIVKVANTSAPALGTPFPLKFKNKLGVKPKNAWVAMFSKRDGTSIREVWSESITLNQNNELEVTFQGLEESTDYVGVLIYEG